MSVGVTKDYKLEVRNLHPLREEKKMEGKRDKERAA